MVVVGSNTSGVCQRRGGLSTAQVVGSAGVGQPPSLFKNKSTECVVALATHRESTGRGRGTDDSVVTGLSRMFSDILDIAACQESDNRMSQCFIRQGKLQETGIAERRRVETTGTPEPEKL